MAPALGQKQAGAGFLPAVLCFQPPSQGSQATGRPRLFFESESPPALQGRLNAARLVRHVVRPPGSPPRSPPPPPSSPSSPPPASACSFGIYGLCWRSVDTASFDCSRTCKAVNRTAIQAGPAGASSCGWRASNNIYFPGGGFKTIGLGVPTAASLPRRGTLLILHSAGRE